MAKQSLRFSWYGALIILGCCVSNGCCVHERNNNQIIFNNKILEQSVMEFYRATHSDTTVKTLFCLTVQFHEDSLEYNFWEEMNLNALLGKNIIGYTQMGNLTILITCEQLDNILHMDHGSLMQILKLNFPGMYQRYQKAKLETPPGEVIWVNEPTVINDEWQCLKFIHDSLVYKMQYDSSVHIPL